VRFPGLTLNCRTYEWPHTPRRKYGRILFGTLTRRGTSWGDGGAGRWFTGGSSTSCNLPSSFLRGPTFLTIMAEVEKAREETLPSRWKEVG